MGDLFVSAIAGSAAAAAWLIPTLGPVARRSVESPTIPSTTPPTTPSDRKPRHPGSGEGAAVGALAEALAARVRSGASLPEALGQADAPEPLGEDVRVLALELRRGVPLDDALRGLAEGAPLERRLLVAALRLAARHGGRTADALDGVANTLRDRRAVAAELAAQTSQARLSAWVLVALPPLFLVLGSVVDPRLIGAVATPAGVVVLAVAVALEVVGFVWSRRILASGVGGDT